MASARGRNDLRRRPVRIRCRAALVEVCLRAGSGAARARAPARIAVPDTAIIPGGARNAAVPEHTAREDRLIEETLGFCRWMRDDPYVAGEARLAAAKG